MNGMTLSPVTSQRWRKQSRKVSQERVREAVIHVKSSPTPTLSYFACLSISIEMPLVVLHLTSTKLKRQVNIELKTSTIEINIYRICTDTNHKNRKSLWEHYMVRVDLIGW